MTQRYFVMDDGGRVVNAVSGFISLPGKGFIEATSELVAEGIGVGWSYDFTADTFIDDSASFDPAGEQ